MMHLKFVRVKYPLVVLSLLFAPLTTLAEIPKCVGTSSTVEASTPTARFDFSNNNELVRDLVTGLTWTRCPLGYSIDPNINGCVAKPGATLILGWKDAIAKSVDPAGDGTGSYLGKTSWRVPNIKELASIIEHGCLSPSVNKIVFPNTPVGAYWTNSPISAEGASLTAWVVDFGNGKADVMDASYSSVGNTSNGTPIFAPNATHFVRLVRNSD